MKKRSKILFLTICGVLLILLLFYSDVVKNGVKTGLIISANTIVPSLFPFMVCVLMITQIGVTIRNKGINRILYLCFGHNFDMFFTFLLSMLGGYPIGAKLINEMLKEKKIDNKTANIMLMYCVNGGPAFIVCVVGGILKSRTIGFILLFSHLLSSVIVALLFARKIKKQKLSFNNIEKREIYFSTIFVKSVNEATKSVISICSFIVVFFVIISLFVYFFNSSPNIKIAASFLEITSALYNTKNIYLISFLLGFSGISICCQIIAILSDVRLNVLKFISGRIIHGGLSAVITKIITSIFNISVSTYSNGITHTVITTYSNATLVISMAVMFVFLMIFLYTQNNSGKFIDDVV